VTSWRMNVARWLCAILLSSLPAVSSAQTVQQQLTDEVKRLRKEASAQPEGELWKDLKPSVETGLDRIEKDVAASRVLVAVRGLANIRFHLLAVAYVNQRAEVARGDLSGFEREWRRVDGEMRPVERLFREATWGKTPAVVRALAESTLATTRPLYEASREYAAATAVPYGLFYLGQARGALDFAQFSRKLRFAESYGHFPARSFAVEIDRLEQQVEKAYRPPLSIDRHRDFIGLNAWIKRAVELDQGKLYYGALYAYLEATRSLGELLVASPRAADLARLKESAIAFEKRLGEPRRDHSIARLFIELAGRETERAQASEEASGRSARAIVEQVLPAYFAALERTAGGPATAAKAELTVTLVRWPYT